MSERDPAAGDPAGPPEEDPRIRGEKHPVARMIALGIVLSLIGIAIALLIDWFPVSAAGSADEIDTVYDVLLICSVPIFVLVMTVAIYSVVRFRAKPGDMRDGAPIHGNTRLEVVWVTIPFLMVTALAIYGWIVLDDLEAKQPNTLVVNVTGQQFTWSFDYPSEKVKSNTLVLPKDRPVEFRIHTKDVLHSFWVPEFRLKSDAVPGLTTKIRLTPNRIGRYQVVCAELCGIGHSTMRQNVRVVARRLRLLARGPEAGGRGRRGAAAAGDRRGGGADGRPCSPPTAAAAPHLQARQATGGRPRPRRDRDPDRGFIRESIVDPNKGEERLGIMPQDFGDKLSPDERLSSWSTF